MSGQYLSPPEEVLQNGNAYWIKENIFTIFEITANNNTYQAIIGTLDEAKHFTLFSFGDYVSCSIFYNTLESRSIANFVVIRG